MAAQRIEFGRQDAGAPAGCECHGAHAAHASAPGTGEAAGPMTDVVAMHGSTSGTTGDAVTGATGDTVTELAVDGMTCDHCVRAVTSEVGAVAGVDEVEIELVAGGTSRVRVRSGIPLDPAALATAIDEAGYTLHA